MDMVSRAGLQPWPSITTPLLPMQKSDIFRSDVTLARSSGNKKDLYEMGHFIEIVRRQISIPSDYKTHELKGDFKGWMDSHMRPDFLLIWKIEKISNIKQLTLLRCGPHSLIF